MLLSYLKHAIKSYFLNKDSIDYIHDHVKWKTAFAVGWLVAIMLVLLETLVFFVLGSSLEIEIILRSFRNIILYPFGIVIGGGMLHLLLKLFRGKAKFTETIKFLITLSIFPALCFTTLNLGVEALGNTVLLLFFTFVMLGLGIWGIYVALKVYSLLHRISMFRVFFALFMLPLLAMIIGILVGTFVTFQTASSLQSKALDIGRNSESYSAQELTVERLEADGTIYIRNRGVTSVEITAVYLKDSQDNPTGCVIEIGTVESGIVSFLGDGCTLTSGQMYKVIVLTDTGLFSSKHLVK